MSRPKTRTLLLYLFLLAITLAAYLNHFQNEFHFDDFHTITTNPLITSLNNIPRFFLDGTTFSTHPMNAAYRPVVSTSLAIDYWLGHSFQPFFFHLSTFLWFCLQLVLMVLLFRRLMDLADPHPSNLWTAWIAAAVYGLHPANAETVNYVIQRGDLYNTLGVVGSLLWFIADPGRRKRGLYLIPALLAYLAKAPALIYPFLLLVYVFLFEQDGTLALSPGAARRSSWKASLRAVWPAFAVTAAAAIFISAMTPSTLLMGATSPALYRLTQPWVALHYFQSFFLPTELSADSDWTPFTDPLCPQALAGYLFVALSIWIAIRTSRKRATRPIAFGIVWFFVTLLPTSLAPLGDVTNDHRMFFPFVGLALAVFWSARLLLFRKPGQLSAGSLKLRAAAAGMAAILLAAAIGTHQRNEVWHTELTLWRDVALKSPMNGRGLLNYGTALLNNEDYTRALAYLKLAELLTPRHYVVHINLGIVYGALGNDREALEHFQRSLMLAPSAADARFFFARWLNSKGMRSESQGQAEVALRADPSYLPSRHLLMQIYSDQGNREALDSLIQDTLRLAPGDEMTLRFLNQKHG